MVKLAQIYAQTGWVANTQQGINLAIEGCPKQQQLFLSALRDQCPYPAEIKELIITPQPLANFQAFEIQSSRTVGKPSVFVLPDSATCPACIDDINNSQSRFYRYPFTSCCQCGPRYSIMQKQPYDRENTSMSVFKLCSDCLNDYQNPNNRRFHTQTLACPACGPQLQLLDSAGNVIAGQERALTTTTQLLKTGNIIAIKGIGGYQLLVNASNELAIEQLRKRKHRLYKPFAVMVKDLPNAHALAHISLAEQFALTCQAAPIVLLTRKDHQSIAQAVAPNNPMLGIMLSYSPLHHLILQDFSAPLVVTSGNRQNEPLCIDNEQALENLAGIADYFLIHNRGIVRPLDDSIVRVINQKSTLLRRARGYAPLPIEITTQLPDSLSLGGHLKNTIAIGHNQHIVVSQHLGDMDSEIAQNQFKNSIADLQDFYHLTPNCILHDKHSGYGSSQLAGQLPGTKQTIQHHYAHALSCMAEHGLSAPALAIVWDGSGLGDDGRLWGGEFLLINDNGYQRYAHFRNFPLPGGIQAFLEPRRSALGLLYAMHPTTDLNEYDLPFSSQELSLLKQAVNKNINCPLTSSAGRLFDAVASLLGVCHKNTFEGQSAIALEALAARGHPEKNLATPPCYPFQITNGTPMIIDWQPMIEQILIDCNHQTSATIALRFHHTLSAIMRTVAQMVDRQNLILSGGCMQNALLVENAFQELENAGFNVYCHHNIPPNDGGLSIGQIYAQHFIG